MYIHIICSMACGIFGDTQSHRASSTTYYVGIYIVWMWECAQAIYSNSPRVEGECFPLYPPAIQPLGGLVGNLKCF